MQEVYVLFIETRAGDAFYDMHVARKAPSIYVVLEAKDITLLWVVAEEQEKRSLLGSHTVHTRMIFAPLIFIRGLLIYHTGLLVKKCTRVS